jgi:ABC-2 type transport system permease protein
MNVRTIRAIVRKDIKVISQSKGVTIPLIIVPLIMFILMPLAVALAVNYSDLQAMNLGNAQEYMEKLPAGLLADLTNYNEQQSLLVMLIVYFLAPFFLIVPLMVANVIAADSFAGEKERKTMEALLYTPTTDQELFMGKMLSAWLPAMAVTLAGFIVYALIANLAAWPVMGRIYFPNSMWLLLVFWVAPAAAGLGLGSMVLVSSRVSTFQEAYQIGAAVVLPVAILAIGQAAGVIYFNLWLVFLLGLVLWVINGLIFWFAVRTFQRGEIIARL